MASRGVPPVVVVVCHSCGSNCTTKCYALHKDSFSCHQRTCKLHVGQPYTELKNNVIVPGSEYRTGPKEVKIRENGFQPEPNLPSNFPIKCMECNDKSCSFGCMDYHKDLDDSKYYYCHNKSCINHTYPVHVSLDDKRGKIFSTVPKQQRPEPPRYEYRSAPLPKQRPEPPRYESKSGPPPRHDAPRGPRPEYRDARPSRHRDEYYEYTAEPTRTKERGDEGYYPPRPGGPRPYYSGGSHDPPPAPRLRRNIPNPFEPMSRSWRSERDRFFGDRERRGY
ncbi:hypothetical protein QBC38DRAFT_459982 [Podospora fimiseda]|uniref:Uncharacterized protein n=1 Tax=Podospora fimiseda TaxID=252190 RepID=A0AAN6YQJ9_9PEZI|nr:hypothetical protein QBC38DRAFT_459982 [Podospora fimiseda]